MHIELYNGSWIQVISAENPENLRREQLDVVILAEASKLNENLYDRYLYARVEKRHGIVLVPTTHKGYGWVYDKFYVPIKNAKGSLFCFDDGVIEAEEGEVYQFDNSVPHWVENNSDEDRISMIVCVRTFQRSIHAAA